MNLVATIVTLLACLLMFVVKRETKAALLIMGAMTLTLVTVPGVPLHRANFLLQVAFLVSEWQSLGRHVRELMRTPYLWGLMLVVSVSTLLAALTSPYVQLRDFLQSELLFKYFSLAYAFWAVGDEKSLKPVLRISLYCLIVITIFGGINLITRNAAVVNALTSGKTSLTGVNLGDVYTESTRFRVQSIFRYAFDYGYICAVILLLHLFAWHRKLEGIVPFAIAMGCCLFGIVTCECRVVWVCCFLSVSCFYIWCFPLNRTSLLGILTVCAFIFSYSTIEVVEEKVDSVTDIFKEDPTTRGSSIEMRIEQYTITLLHIQGHKMLGRGHGYWSASKGQESADVEGLGGVESVILHYLLERGIIGLILWVVFYAWLFYVFWQNRLRLPFLTGLGVSVWTAYILFAVGTGELGSVYPTMLLLGMALKAIQYNQRKTKLLALLLRIRKWLKERRLTTDNRRQTTENVQ